MTWEYEKLTDGLVVKRAPFNDLSGEITGRCVLNLKAWFDENPDERMRLGWIKHIYHIDEIAYDKGTQVLLRNNVRIDEYTIEEEVEVVDKPEELILLEEIDDLTGGDLFGLFHFANV